MGLSFWLSARILLYAPSHRQDSTYHSLCYTSRGTLAGMQKRLMGPSWGIDPTTHCTMRERSYHGATSRSYINTFYLRLYGVTISIEKKFKLFWKCNLKSAALQKYIYIYFSFQPVLHDWYNKGRGMCYPVCGMVHIKEPLLLIDKSSPCGGSRFPLSLSEWSLTI